MSVINAGERLSSKVVQEHVTPELYEMFHENTKLNKYKLKVLQYQLAENVSDSDFKPASLNNNKCYPTADITELKVNYDYKISLIEALGNRRSKRNFTGDEVPFNDLSSILKYSGGISGGIRIGDREVPLRAYPSGGALYPLEIYLYANQVHGLERGIYHYNVRQDTLEKLRVINKSNELSRQFEIKDQPIEDASVTFIITAMFHRTTYKYGNRGYRFIFIELGHLMQNLSLMAVANDLGACGPLSIK